MSDDLLYTAGAREYHALLAQQAERERKALKKKPRAELEQAYLQMQHALRWVTDTRWRDEDNKALLEECQGRASKALSALGKRGA
jgi:hypothetical protein